MPRYVVDQLLRSWKWDDRQPSPTGAFGSEGNIDSQIDQLFAARDAQTKENDAQRAVEQARIDKRTDEAAARVAAQEEADRKRVDKAETRKKGMEALAEQERVAKLKYNNAMAEANKTLLAHVVSGIITRDNVTPVVLSPKEAKKYQAELESIYETVTGALSTENLPGYLIKEATGILTLTETKIARLNVYIPAIDAALEKDISGFRTKMEDTESDMKIRIRTLQEDLTKSEAKATAAQEAYEACKSLEEKGDLADASTLRDAQAKYGVLQKEAAEKRNAYQAVSEEATKAKRALEAMEKQLQASKEDATILYERYVQWEASEWGWKSKTRAKKQEEVAVMKNRVKNLTAAVEKAERTYNALHEQSTKTYIENEVAAAKLKAAKKRVAQLEGSVNIVVGKPL